jgi:hypothetical protein
MAVKQYVACAWEVDDNGKLIYQFNTSSSRDITKIRKIAVNLAKHDYRISIEEWEDCQLLKRYEFNLKDDITKANKDNYLILKGLSPMYGIEYDNAESTDIEQIQTI